MGLWPLLPGDDPDWRDPDEVARELFEQSTGRPALEPDEIDRLIAKADELDGRHLPYVWGMGSPVTWAEQITREAAEPPPYTPPVVGPNYAEATKRLGALRRAEERSAHDSLPRWLTRLLGALDRLKRRS